MAQYLLVAGAVSSVYDHVLSLPVNIYVVSVRLLSSLSIRSKLWSMSYCSAQFCRNV